MMRRASVLHALLLCAWLLAACAPAPLPDVPREAPAVDTAVPAGIADSTMVARGTYPRISALDVSSLRAGKAPLEIRYTLDAPARVRLRLVDRDSPGLILRTLLDWAPRAAGPQVERWDGLDAHGGQVNPRQVSVALVAEPDPGASAGWDWEALEALSHPEHRHYTHDDAICRDLNVHLTSPGLGATLEGLVDVCAELEGSRGMPDGEYHVAIYLEGRTAWDGRLPATGPFCQSWDTRNVPDGEHRLAITFNDLHDHAGSDWISVTVNNGG